MIVHRCTQGSPEWWELKRGVPSASNFSRIITSRGKLSAQAEGYAAELCSEIKSLNPKFFTSRGTEAMRHGATVEPEARRFYEMERSVDVDQVGVCFTDDERFCASPDGLVEDVGCLELKAPLPKTHAQYLLKGELPAAYRQQVHGQLVVTGLAWVDFLSYCPGLDPLLVRVTPDEFTELVRKALEEFWGTFQSVRAKLCPVTPAEEAIKAWKKFLRQVGDEIDAFNRGLPNMSGLAYEIRRECWELSKKHGDDRGWLFDPTAKTFSLPPKPEF